MSRAPTLLLGLSPALAGNWTRQSAAVCHIHTRALSSISLALTHGNRVSWPRGDGRNLATSAGRLQHAPVGRQSQAAQAATLSIDGANLSSSRSGARGGPQVSTDDLGLDALIISPSAVRKLRALRERAVADGKPGADKTYLRIRVDGGGCSGFKYSFVLESGDPTGDDVLLDRGGGARVIVDGVSLDMLKGSTVDWSEEMMRASFGIVNNPNSESSCGCGSSFAAKA